VACTGILAASHSLSSKKKHRLFLSAHKHCGIDVAGCNEIPGVNTLQLSQQLQ
jgi:hypothetical protein